MELEPVKIGLWDQYGGSMPSGWTRMILEDFEFDFDVLFPPDFDEGDLDDYDVLLFEDGAIPGLGADNNRGFFGGRGPDPETVPEEYRNRTAFDTDLCPRFITLLHSAGLLPEPTPPPERGRGRRAQRSPGRRTASPS